MCRCRCDVSRGLPPSLLRNRSPNVGPAGPQSEGYSVHGMCKLNILKCDTTHITRMLCMYSTLLCSPRVELDMQQLFSAGYRCDSVAAADNRDPFNNADNLDPFNNAENRGFFQ